ncbi:MAG: hypothetical protein GY788_09340 [bacterium]|nr:hypothetical protein [bacterium]
MAYTAKNAFTGLAQAVGDPAFGSAEDFAHVALEVAGVPEDHEVSDPAALASEVEGLLWEAPEGSGMRQIALDLLRGGTSEVCRVADEVPGELLPAEAIADATSSLVAAGREMGLRLDHCELRILDQFPAPYEEATFVAMTYDKGDEASYGIQPGVALRRSLLSPLVSQFYFAHEMVHVTMGRVRTPHLACGIEEGFADLVGHKIAVESGVIPAPLVDEIVLNLRYRTGRHQLSDVYREALRRVALLATCCGWDYLLDVVRSANENGRANVRNLEDPATTETLLSDVQQSFHADPLLNRVLMRSMTYVVSPLAFAVCSTAERGEPHGDLAARLDLSVGAVSDAADEVQGSVFLAVSNEGHISMNEVPPLVSSGQMRYDPRGLQVLLAR